MEHGCKRPTVLSEKFCCPQKTHGHVYHIDFGLCDRSRDGLGIGYPLALALGTGEPVRPRYMCVSLVLPVTVVTLGIGMCEGVGG